jgi:hypothetical protein
MYTAEGVEEEVVVAVVVVVVVMVMGCCAEGRGVESREIYE